MRLLAAIGAVIAVAGCAGIVQPPTQVPPASVARASSASGPLLYVSSSDDDRVAFYQYNDGVAGKLAGSIKEIDPTGICSDNKGNVYVVLFEEHRVDEFTHGATTPESSITFTSAFPYACAVDNSNGNLAVSVQTANNKFNWGWFVDVYLGGGPDRREYYSYSGFTAVHALAYDNAHDLFAIAAPCDSSGYCLNGSNGGPPTLYELAASGYSFEPVALDGLTLQNPTGLAWINPALLVDDANYRRTGQATGIKLRVNASGATVLGVIPFTKTKAGEGIVVRAGVVSVADIDGGAVRSYSISNGSLVSTLHQKRANPLGVTISQKP